MKLSIGNYQIKDKGSLDKFTYLGICLHFEIDFPDTSAFKGKLSFRSIYACKAFVDGNGNYILIVISR